MRRAASGACRTRRWRRCRRAPRRRLVASTAAPACLQGAAVTAGRSSRPTVAGRRRRASPRLARSSVLRPLRAAVGQLRPTHRSTHDLPVTSGRRLGLQPPSQRLPVCRPAWAGAASRPPGRVASAALKAQGLAIAPAPHALPPGCAADGAPASGPDRSRPPRRPRPSTPPAPPFPPPRPARPLARARHGGLHSRRHTSGRLAGSGARGVLLVDELLRVVEGERSSSPAFSLRQRWSDDPLMRLSGASYT